MSGAVFVDTNILVYARDASEPTKQGIATNWLERLWRAQSGRTSMQVLNEYYVTVTRKLKPGMRPDDAWDDVQDLLAWDPRPTDRELLVSAREVERRYRISWWDSLVVAAAQSQDCELLLSEDLQAGVRFGSVTICNPFAARAGEPQTTYRAPTLTRHRSPGRPRNRAA
jgi:predicted nucleic acid-binding protein